MMFTSLIEFLSKEAFSSLLTRFREKAAEKRTDLLEISDVFGPIEPLLKYYVEPNCQNINPANYDEDEPDAVARTPIFRFLTSYLKREFAVQGDGRNQLFVLSDAGVGKSSLLVMVKLCDLLPRVDWEHNLSNNHTVELVKLDGEALRKIRTIEDKTKTVLLLDALDEDPLAWQQPERRMLKILEETSKFHRVVISCRTQFFPEKGVRAHGTQDKISVGGYVCPMIYLSLFDDAQVNEYLERRFPSHESELNRQKRQRSLEILRKAKSLSFRPFLLSHIEDLLERESTDWSELAVYEELVSVWVRREMRKHSKRMIEGTDLILACMAISAKMQENGKRYISKSELSKIMAILPEVSNIANIEYGSKSLLNRTSEGDYRFSHFSIQEFFLAMFVINLADRGGADRRVKRIPLNRSMIRLTRKSLEFISMYNDAMWSPGHGFNLDRLTLDGFDFSDGDWSGFTFRESSLKNANLKNAVLVECVFDGATLTEANLTGSNCQRASFKKSDLSGVTMNSASASGANFTAANFSSSNLVGVTELRLIGAEIKFHNTKMPDGKLRSN